MANPQFISLPAGLWLPVAINVTAGQIHKVLSGPTYLQTYRMTGQAAPTLKSDGVIWDALQNHLEISASAEIDVYIWCDGAAGRVRVDL